MDTTIDLGVFDAIHAGAPEDERAVVEAAVDAAMRELARRKVVVSGGQRRAELAAAVRYYWERCVPTCMSCGARVVAGGDGKMMYHQFRGAPCEGSGKTGSLGVGRYGVT